MAGPDERTARAPSGAVETHTVGSNAHPERIGVIFVHGIGEQRRFEHLDAQVRPLIEAFTRKSVSATVEIAGGDTSTLLAEQDTWSAGAPVRATVREPSGSEKHLYFHEVWWADVNERYSLRKQLAFWLWSLGVWLYPNVRHRLTGGRLMQFPHFPGGWTLMRTLSVRAALFLVSTIFLLAAASIGTAVFLLKRLLDVGALNVIRVFVNYLSAIKLYNQPRAADGGFLDAFEEPPRVSLRRRMIRTLADVACQDYDRWYVFAHSLGSVVAYNGLMENAQALANYLDQPRWVRLKAAHLAGAAEEGSPYVTGDPKLMLPSRPLWLEKDDVVFRDRLLQRFRGLLTYGSPLDKFAAIWPPRAPINIGELMFPKHAEWINVFDPTDPVAGKLAAFSTDPDGKALPNTLITPRNLGYRASPVVLLSHIRYLQSDLADSAVAWILGGKAFQPSGARWLRFEWPRWLLTAVQWLLVVAGLIWAAAKLLPWWIAGLNKLLALVSRAIAGVPGLAAMRPLTIASGLAAAGGIERAIWVVKWSIVTTIAVGAFGWLYFYIVETRTELVRTEQSYWASTAIGKTVMQLLTSLARLFRS